MRECTPQVPLVKLDPNGKPALLNYNLPQSTVYEAISAVDLDILPAKFSAAAKAIPVGSYWSNVPNGSTLQALKTRLLEGDETLILNAELVPRVAVLETLTHNSEDNIVPFIATNTTYASEASTNADIVNRTAAYRFVLPAPHTEESIAQRIVNNYMPIAFIGFAGTVDLRFEKRQTVATPQLSIVLHYKMASFLGDYGAGETVKTFSLLPGEKTTITIKQYQQKEETRKKTENVVDSFSESSANDLQNSIDTENKFSTSNKQDQTQSKSRTMGVNASLTLSKVSVGASVNQTNSKTSSINSAIETQVNSLTKAVSHQVNKTDALRKIDVNSETSQKSTESTEETIVRQLENPNKSRVLNFVFRQLLQDYFTLTYLDDVTIYFDNGLPNSERTVKLPQLDTLLYEMLADIEVIDDVRKTILTYLCSIYDYQGVRTPFVEKVSENLVDLDNKLQQTRTFYRKNKDLSQTYLEKTVKSIVLNVTHRTLRTPSLIVEALLGQGEGLDCYNMQLQDAAVESAVLQNTKIQHEIDKMNAETGLVNQNRIKMAHALNMLDTIGDPIKQAELYKKVFSECCDVPQSGCGCHDKK